MYLAKTQPWFSSRNNNIIILFEKINIENTFIISLLGTFTAMIVEGVHCSKSEVNISYWQTVLI